jgi:hypothetical protein
VVPATRAAAALNSNEPGEPSAADRQHSLTWAQRLQRVFAIDIEVCRGCGGRLRVIASIEDPEVIERILEHLGRDGGPIDPAHPRQAKRRRWQAKRRRWQARRRRRQSRAPPEHDPLI